MDDRVLPSVAVRTRRFGRRWRNVVLAIGAIIVALSAVAIGTLLVPVLRDPTAAYASQPPRLARVESQGETRHGSNVVSEFRLVADSGLVVEVAIRTPEGAVRPRPTVLILGGRHTGRDAARLGEDVENVVVAALSYPYAGNPELPAVLRLRPIQRALFDTVPAIRLATDYLLSQPSVDPTRFELVGVSLGAFLVSPAAVLDRRIRRLWLVHGAGRPAEVIEFALRPEVRFRPLRRMLAALLNELAAGDRFAAERWVGRMTPRPVVVVNARNDERLPPTSVAALHAALRAPSHVVWMDGAHVRPDRPETLEALRALLLRCVAAADTSPDPACG